MHGHIPWARWAAVPCGLQGYFEVYANAAALVRCRRRLRDREDVIERQLRRRVARQAIQTYAGHLTGGLARLYICSTRRSLCWPVGDQQNLSSSSVENWRAGRS
jgi:hypothetical protein